MSLSRLILPAFTLGLLAISPVQAAEMKSPAQAAAGAYTLDSRHTTVAWQVSHLGFSNFMGSFATTEGTLNYDPVDVTKSNVKITIKPDSLYTNVEGFAKELTSGGGWIDAAKGPIVFTSTKVTKLTDTTGTVDGQLTLNGVTKPVSLAVTFVGAGKNDFAKANAIGFSATTTIKRSEFDAGKMVPMVGDEVAIHIETEFQQKIPESAKQ